VPATCGFRRSRSLSVCVSHVLDFVVFSEKAFFWESSNRTTFFFPSSSAYKIWSATWLTRTGPFVCIEQKPTGARCAVTYMRHRAAESHYLRGLVIKGVASATNTLHVSGHQRFFFFFVAIFFGSGDHPSVLSFEGWVDLCYWPCLPTQGYLIYKFTTSVVTKLGSVTDRRLGSARQKRDSDESANLT
jgi:hypothetical protein